ncbi:hypothetical protein KJ068_07295 [bacterium]|nr:hypothetical protein [bacterium]
MMNKLLATISLSAIILWFGDFGSVEAQTHGTALLQPASMKSADNDTVVTITNLSVDSLRLVVGLEEMQAHIARMTKMGRKAGLMWMDLKDTHIIAITVFRQQHLITDDEAKMALKVKTPKGESETREMYFIAGLDSFNEGFNLEAKGKYRFTVLLERKGKSQRAEFTYEVK